MATATSGDHALVAPWHGALAVIGSEQAVEHGALRSDLTLLLPRRPLAQNLAGMGREAAELDDAREAHQPDR